MVNWVHRRRSMKFLFQILLEKCLKVQRSSRNARLVFDEMPLPKFISEMAGIDGKVEENDGVAFVKVSRCGLQHVEDDVVCAHNLFDEVPKPSTCSWKADELEVDPHQAIDKIPVPSSCLNQTEDTIFLLGVTSLAKPSHNFNELELLESALSSDEIQVVIMNNEATQGCENYALQAEVKCQEQIVGLFGKIRGIFEVQSDWNLEKRVQSPFARKLPDKMPEPKSKVLNFEHQSMVVSTLTHQLLSFNNEPLICGKKDMKFEGMTWNMFGSICSRVFVFDPGALFLCLDKCPFTNFIELKNVRMANVNYKEVHSWGKLRIQLGSRNRLGNGIWLPPFQNDGACCLSVKYDLQLTFIYDKVGEIDIKVKFLVYGTTLIERIIYLYGWLISNFIQEVKYVWVFTVEQSGDCIIVVLEHCDLAQPLWLKSCNTHLTHHFIVHPLPLMHYYLLYSSFGSNLTTKQLYLMPGIQVDSPFCKIGFLVVFSNTRIIELFVPFYILTLEDKGDFRGGEDKIDEKHTREVFNIVGFVAYWHKYVSEALASRMPGYLKVYIGTEANELATLMVKLYTRNHGMISLRNAYHGGSAGAFGLTALNTGKYSMPQGDIHHVVNSDPYRDIFGSDAFSYARGVQDYIDFGTSASNFSKVLVLTSVLQLLKENLRVAIKCFKRKVKVFIFDPDIMWAMIL